MKSGEYIYCGRIELVDKPYVDIQSGEDGIDKMVWMFPLRPVPNNDVKKPTLNNHLHQIDLQCQERYDTLMEGYKRCWEIPEELKARNQMKWVQLMNLAKAEAESNIMREIIFE